MQITVPFIRNFRVGCSRPNTWGVVRSQGWNRQRSYFITAGYPYVAFEAGLTTYRRDFKIARRAHAASALVSFPLLVGLFVLLCAPLAFLVKAGEFGEKAGFWLADTIFNPISDVLLPTQRYGIRDTLKALLKEVTQ